MPRKSKAVEGRDRGQAFSIYFPSHQVNGDIAEIMRLIDAGEVGSISEFVQIAVAEKLRPSKKENNQ